jgi:hypothetical protein
MDLAHEQFIHVRIIIGIVTGLTVTRLLTGLARFVQHPVRDRTLRSDTNGPAHRGMLDLLRSGFDHNWQVSTDAEIGTGKKNGKSIRVWLLK